MKQLVVDEGQNGVADFPLFTEVPKAARIVGLVTNDLANVLNPNDVNFGEKQAPSWLPISFQDYQGNDILRIYSDEFGAYNAQLPSTYTINPPIPTGVSPNMITVCLNHPGPIPKPGAPGVFITDPYFNPHFSQTCLTFDYWPGKITYLDTPVIPVAAFTGATNATLDCEFSDGTPIIYSVSGPGAGGPYVPNTDSKITILSAGNVDVPNPDYDPTNPMTTPTIKRDFGFGSVKGQVTLGGLPLTNIAWSSKTISGTVPAGAQTGQLVVTRGDNGKSTLMGVTVTVGPPPGGVIRISSTQSLQAAIDSAPPEALLLVAPGKYDESIIVYKNIQLQGWGAYSTFLNASPFPSQKIADWQAKLSNIVNAAPAVVDLIPGQDPQFVASMAPGILVLAKEGDFTPTQKARIDGFTISGANEGGAILVNAFAHYLEISNNRLINNLGNLGGGIRIGTPSLVNVADDGYLSNMNDHITIHHNKIAENGGITGGAGVAIYNGGDNYAITENYICGNFTTLNGAGIHHLGLSNGGLIFKNTILFNEAFYGGSTGGEGGGIWIGGEPSPAGAPGGTLSQGSGSVTVNDNLIQGNLAGSGDGGGIRLFSVNGQDIVNSISPPDDFHTINILNNMIVNNVSGFAGGGIALQDAARVNVINNTLANNDSTASGANAFGGAGFTLSTPRGAGVVSRFHSTLLENALTAKGITQSFSDPVLANNILWHNRSFYWDGTVGGGVGGLVPNASMPYWDLEVVAGGPTDLMNPQYSVLTDTTGYAGTNIMLDPLFLSEYFNALQWAAVAQEGGNFVNITYKPLTPMGDYHIWPGLSPAIDAGTDSYLAVFMELPTDFDGNVRPTPTTPPTVSDIGADEIDPTKSVLKVLKVGVVSGSGTVTSLPAGIGCGVDCIGLFTTGSVVTLTATPDPGSVFGTWSGDLTGTAATKTITVDANKTVTANFIGPSLSVTFPNGGETLKKQTTKKIKWTHTGSPGGHVKIELLKGGVVYRTIAASAPNTPGEYPWTLGAGLAPASDYQIRITSTTIDTVSDTSDANFNITD